MYLRTLTLTNVKRISKLTLDFTRDGKPRMWTLLIGENGTCKTTILQAIALASSGSILANQLAAKLTPSIRPRSQPTSAPKIEAEFGFGKIGHDYYDGYRREYPGLETDLPRQNIILKSTIKIAPKQNNLTCSSTYKHGATQFGINHHPLDQVRGHDPILPHWFVAAYGVHRMLSASAGDQHSIQDRLSSLFGPTKIRSIGFYELFARSSDGKQFAKQYESTMRQVLTYPGLLPDVVDLKFSKKVPAKDLAMRQQVTFKSDDSLPTVSLPTVWLSHGYQSSIAWLADLVGQILFEAKAPVPPEEMEGLVLIDEIDLHLHPTWQVAFIDALRSVFKRLQFVATTHSPLTLPALRADEVIVLDSQDGKVVHRQVTASPQDMTGTELYQHYFEIEALIPSRVGRLRWEFSQLATNPYRSDKNDQRIDDIERELKTLDAHVPSTLRAPRAKR